MSITWINAVAFAGLALVVLPIAIHLLVRQQTRVRAFPSLRFLHETALAAFRRRAIQDATLLACRIAIVAAAVAALAGPIVRAASRDAEYASRVSRAIVPIDGAEAVVEPTSAFRTAEFRRATLADAIADALRWLDAQPPSRREIHFSGAFRRGAIGEGDLVLVPPGVGIRFLERTPEDSADVQTTPRLTRRGGTLVRIDQQVQLTADATRVDEGASHPVSADRVRIMAAPAEQALADAALGAALDAGVAWTTDDRPLVIVWAGAAPATMPAGAVIVRMPVPQPVSSAASAIWNAIARAMPQEITDPVLVPREQLRAWSKQGGRPTARATPADEGDRRWLWAAALALLALEHVLRRERAGETRSVDGKAEARVA